MPYLPTSQDFLEQSSQLLKAYPDTTRITTKYTYPRPSSKPNRISKRTAKSKPIAASTETSTPATTTTTTTPQPATLTLKTFNPSSGICLKYRTNKAAEVGRLIVGLGRLASGEGGFEDSSVAAAGTGGDVEMGDAPAPATPPVGEAGSGVDGGGKGGGGGGGGKKKKSGKGKR